MCVAGLIQPNMSFLSGKPCDCSEVKYFIIFLSSFENWCQTVVSLLKQSQSSPVSVLSTLG